MRATHKIDAEQVQYERYNAQDASRNKRGKREMQIRCDMRPSHNVRRRCTMRARRDIRSRCDIGHMIREKQHAKWNDVFIEATKAIQVTTVLVCP